MKCEAITGILKEGNEVIEDFDNSTALDAGMIAAAQAVEDYEMARYGVLRTWAEQPGMVDAAKLLEQPASSLPGLSWPTPRRSLRSELSSASSSVFLRREAN